MMFSRQSIKEVTDQFLQIMIHTYLDKRILHD